LTWYETTLEGKKQTIHPHLSSEKLWIIEQVGCASHSNFQSKRDTCPQNKIWQHCPSVEQIRKGAREKVLDEVIKWIEREGFYRGMNATYNYIRQLRQAGES
jgi:hypothetical protein